MSYPSRILRRRLLALMFASLLGSQLLAAEEGSKGIVPPSDGSTATPAVTNQQALHLDLELVKRRVAVGEPILFTARGNRDFYLYLYGLQDDGTLVSLFPSADDSDNRLGGGQDHRLPRQGYIYDLAPGSKTIFALASLSPQTLPDASGYKGIVNPMAGDGDRIVRELKLEVIAKPDIPFTVQVSPASARVRIMNIKPRYQPGMGLPPGDYQLEVSSPGYQLQRITVQHDGKHTAHAITLQAEPALVDTAPATPVPASAEPVPIDLAADHQSTYEDPAPPRLLLSSEAHSFRVNEPVSVDYGATLDGWVHLFLLQRGNWVPLDSKPVQEGHFYTLKALATNPPGEQRLVALWDTAETVSPATLEKLKQQLDGGSAKALGLVLERTLVFKTLAIDVVP